MLERAQAHAGAPRRRSMRPGRATWVSRKRGIIALVNEGRLRRILTRMLDENEFLSPYGIRSLSRYHAEHPYIFLGATAGIPGGLSAGGIRHRHVRRQLELARTDLDAGQRADHPRAAALLRVLRRQLQDRMPDRLRQSDEPVRGRPRNRQPADPDIPARREPASGRSLAEPRNSRATPTGATICCSTNISMATTAPASAPAIRPAGPGSSAP